MQDLEKRYYKINSTWRERYKMKRIVRRFCFGCRYKTLPLPPKPFLCSGCGDPYTIID